jgi:serine/threonine protein kinase
MPFKVIPEADLKFESSRVLGMGSFGKVVAARYEGRLVAVKSLSIPKKGGLTPSEKLGLEREIRALSNLTHPNIVTLVGVCYHADSSVSIVEELADGGDLFDFISAVGPRLTVQHKIKLALDIARGLEFMHHSGVSHNDIKSANVLICKGTAVLTDFGMAHAFATSLGQGTLSPGAVGTLPYMAPENMDPDDPFYRKPTADIFSFGCILYELATGSYPWKDEGWGTMQYLQQVNFKKKRPALTAVADVGLRALIERTWVHNPAERITAVQLVKELTGMHVGVTPTPDGAAMRKLVGACNRNGITRADYIRALRNLEAFDIILICDDSGSMASKVKQGDGKVTTRWGELKDVVKVVVDIAAALDDNGVDIYFLNREPILGVTDPAVGMRRFQSGPEGSTPLSAAIKRALHDKGSKLNTEEGSVAGSAVLKKRLLFLIATDGQPDEGKDEFAAVLRALPENCHVQMMAVTDDDDATKYMSELDGQVRHFDVCDDYESEKSEILSKQRPGFTFSHGDYIVKALLGAIDPFFDLLDERALPEGMAPLPFPSFPPLPKNLHYRSRAKAPGESSGGGA